MVLLATILSCHDWGGQAGVWLCGDQAPHRRDDSHGLLPLLWTMQSRPPKSIILHKSSHVVYHATTGEVKLMCGAVEARPLTVVTTRIGHSPSSRRRREGLQNILYYRNHLV